MNQLAYFITQLFDLYDGLRGNESVFFFSGENCIWSPCFLSITEWLSLDTSNETSWIDSVFSMFCWEWFVYWWYIQLYFIIDQENVHFLWEMLFSTSLYINFTWCINQFILLNTFPFLFPHTFLLINSIFFSFDYWIFCHLTTCLKVSSCFLCFFKCCECLLPWIRQVLYDTSDEYQLKKQSLRKLFLVWLKEITPILVTRFLGNEW